MPWPWRYGAAALTIIVIGMLTVPSDAARQAQQAITISVPGIPGPYCMYGIEKRLADLPAVERIDLLWDQDRIRVVVKNGMAIPRGQIDEAVKRSEYPYEYSISQ